MIFYQEIKEQIEGDFQIFLSTLLKVNANPRKYFYWSFDFFRIVGGLSFQYFSLSEEQKDEINKIGSEYFESEDVYFEINKNSHRHDLLIKNISKFFESSVTNQQRRYEYIKEFILWKIVSKLESKKIITSEVVKQQRNNYLLTYITYLINFTTNPTLNPFANYIKYSLTSKGEELIKKLDELDREYIYDSKTKKEIKKITRNSNPELRKKIENLFVLKEEEPKMHFVFSRNGGGEKEELRELLDIMGSDKSANLYRGQADSSWNLDASITRESKYRDNEGDMYYDILSLKPDAFENDKSVYERLITMQHFGMPTRLMDVTRNPLVSIFFSCNNLERKESDGVIFTFKPENKSDFLNFEDKRLKSLAYLFNEEEIDWEEEETHEEKVKEFLSKTWFVRGVAKNQRISNQSGDFIFVGNGDNIKDELYKLPQMTIIIDSKSKEVLIEQLESLNIHGGAVYPDLTHMSTYIKHKYLNDRLVIPIRKKTVSDKIGKTKSTKKKIKPTDPITKEDIIKSFDFEEIKKEDRNTQLDKFSTFYNLDKNGLEKIIEDFLFTERKPFRDEVADIMNDKPSKLKEKKKIDLTSEKIITFAKLIAENNE